MRKNKNKQSKVALLLLTRSLRKQDSKSLELIISVSNMILEERKKDNDLTS